MEGDCFALFGRLFQSFALRYEKDFWPLVVAFSNLQISCCISKGIKAATGVSYEKSVQVLCSTSIVLVNVLLPIKLEERLLFLPNLERRHSFVGRMGFCKPPTVSSSFAPDGMVQLYV